MKVRKNSYETGFSFTGRALIKGLYIMHKKKRRTPTTYSNPNLLGFSLIEMLVVLAIIAILATIAIPSSNGKINRVRVAESLKLVEGYKSQIENHYKIANEFPRDNKEAGLPKPEQIIGNFLQETSVDDGAFHLTLGNKIVPALQGKTISVRPIFVPEAANAPISWICGYDSVPEGMVAGGENRTDADVLYLPLECR
ncbi:MAG: type IV pilus assembly protein PilA [Lentisphaeria bacterium]|jgi:type IV pilus assembly protein PilA